MLTKKAEDEQRQQQAVHDYSSFSSDKLVKHINNLADLHQLMAERHERAEQQQQQQQGTHLAHQPDVAPSIMHGQSSFPFAFVNTVLYFVCIRQTVLE